MNTHTSNIPTTGKPHFEILDGLRGIAALSIVLFHFMEIGYSDFTKNFIAHGFLAVDFFFCLSGFVIAYAYDDRIQQMGVTEFFKARLIRLHPMVVMGAILGLLAFLFDPFGGNAAAYSPLRVALLFLASLTMVPFPAMEERFFNLFGLNAPAWSLFWEYIANIIYALVLYKLARKYIIVLAFLAAVALCYVSHKAGGSLLGGWNGDSFWDGGARIAYSFLAGMLIYRSNWIIKNNLGFLGMSLLLIPAFLVPFGEWNWLTQPFIVLIYFPLLISLGAGTSLGDSSKKLCAFSGKISYPLYMTHYAFIWMFFNYYTTAKPDTGTLTMIIIIGMMLLVGFAYLVMVLYDIPVRKYLTRKRLER